MNRFKKVIFFPLLLQLTFLCSFGQNESVNLTWNINPEVSINPEINRIQILTPYECQECFYTITGDFNLPYYTTTIPTADVDILSANIKNVKYAASNSQRIQNAPKEFEISTRYVYDNGVRYAKIKLIPLRNKGNNTEYVTSFEWDIQTAPSKETYRPERAQFKNGGTTTSVLVEGDFYKIAVPSAGVYKITSAFLNSNGIDVNSISLSKFKIYGNGGQQLPEIIRVDRPDDLLENDIYVSDANGNDKLDADDYILWYSPGPHTILFNPSEKNYIGDGHDYDIASHYFITWQGQNGKRIKTEPAGQNLSPNGTITKYDHVIYHESNEENHIKSGRMWWGDKMQIARQKNFLHQVPGAITGDTAKFKTLTSARSTSPSSMNIRLNGGSLSFVSYNAVTGDYERNFANYRNTNSTFLVPSGSIEISYNYNKPTNDAAAWIDYYTLTVPRRLEVFDNQQIIRTYSLGLSGTLKYDFANFNSSYRLWDVSTPTSPFIQGTTSSGNGVTFTRTNINASSSPEFVVFNPDVAPLPSMVGKIENQNLHGISDVDYIMITAPEILEQAERLANFHRERGLNVVVVDKNKVYNEFSSGSQDVTGIRDFVRMVYQRGLQSGNRLKYLLLFGDASYDYRDIESNNTNIVPIYQSLESNNPPHSYCSDDYYALLDSSEGRWGIDKIDEQLDIGVGRLPASNSAEAKVMVDKIIHYHSEASRGDWMQRVTFIADDEDDNRHLEPSEDMTDFLYEQSPELNVKKIWLDAYEQVSFGSGNKYPKVNEEIVKMIGSQGTLIFNYVGHGGENGMAHERILTRPEIQSWKNYDKLSFFVTASCELAKIDNLEIESPGELMMLNPDGGAIGMLATTRLVYIGTNTDINEVLINRNLLLKQNGQLPALGEVYRQTRNRNSGEGTNARCFILLSDPAISLLSPRYKVVSTKINGTDASIFSDTLKALELVTIEGEIRDEDGVSLLSDFNGELFPTFFDKPSNYRTLGQDAESFPREFLEQNRIIYKGNVSVTNGKFSFQFIVPKDIAYNVDSGKLSYYAKDGLDHAGGAELSYKIGGTADSLADDNAFDELKLFIDDESWAFGGTTSSTPDMLATLYDANGINTIGSGIGREMEAILDEGTPRERSIILNDFYKPDLNSYQSGKIEYPFEELETGRHTLKLKVWDVYNNSAEAYTEFVVTEEEDVQIANLLNYPNPFNNYTEFHFDHNKAGQSLTVNINVMTVAGNVVKSITQDIPNAPAHSSEITWDGRDEFGDLIGRGVYLYTLSVKAEDGSTFSKTEKLYILN